MLVIKKFKLDLLIQESEAAYDISKVCVGFIFQVAIVVGGGNIFRGASWVGSSGLDRSSADYIG